MGYLSFFQKTEYLFYNTRCMPQLDLLTFFTQFFWAILCLFVFYFFVNKLILPELTRVLKYRSKASALYSAGDRPDMISQRGKESSSDNLSHSVGKSGSSALYQYAISSSVRVLMEAREKRDTFLNGVTSGKAVNANGYSSTSSPSGETSKSESSMQTAPTKSTKSDPTSAQAPERDQKMKSFSKEESKKVHKPSLNPESDRNSQKTSSKGSSKSSSKGSSKGSKSLKGGDGSKS